MWLEQPVHGSAKFNGNGNGNGGVAMMAVIKTVVMVIAPMTPLLSEWIVYDKCQNSGVG